MPRPALEDRPETGADTERSEDRQDGRILAAAASRGRGIGLGAQQATPLPKKQLSVLLAMRFAEPISFSVIFPFVNQVRTGPPFS